MTLPGCAGCSMSVALFSWCALCAMPAIAQPAWKPEKAVELSAPSGPGGGTDKTARLIQRIWQERRPTVIFITHDVPEAVFLANRVVVLSKGRVLDQIDVALPRPRVWDDLIEDEEFKRLSAQVLHMVRSA